jgi:hypothetical protein
MLTAQQVAADLSAPVQVIRRWCRLQLLPSSKAAGRWSIAPFVRPPYRSGAMIAHWQQSQGASEID